MAAGAIDLATAGFAGATAGLATAGFGAAVTGLAGGGVAGVWASNRLTGKRVNKIRMQSQASDWAGAVSNGILQKGTHRLLASCSTGVVETGNGLGLIVEGFKDAIKMRDPQ